MNAADRRRGIEIRPDGSAWDHSTYRMWIDQLDRRAPRRATVLRLSLTDPACVEVEASARGARAVA